VANNYSSPLSNATKKDAQGVAVLSGRVIAKANVQLQAAAMLAASPPEVTVAIYCRIYTLGRLGKSGEKRLLVGTSVA